MLIETYGALTDYKASTLLLLKLFSNICELLFDGLASELQTKYLDRLIRPIRFIFTPDCVD